MKIVLHQRKTPYTKQYYVKDDFILAMIYIFGNKNIFVVLSYVKVIISQCLYNPNHFYVIFLKLIFYERMKRMRTT
jgi:hypothetical protein